MTAPVATGPARRRPAPSTLADRAAFGRAARELAPRADAGAWEPSTGRRDPVAVLEEQATTRLADLVPIRYGRMVTSPFAFYRGAAAIMAADLADAPSSGLIVQLCGDAHLSNFGVFAAPDRRLVFSLNDFDETLPGPFEWDVKRLMASFAVAGRERGFSSKKRKDIVLAAARSYREAMCAFAEMSTLEVWYTRLDTDQILERFGADAGPKELRNFRKATNKAETKDSLRAAAKLTRVVDGRTRFVSDPPLLVTLDDLVGADEAARLVGSATKVLRSYSSTLTDDRRELFEHYRFGDIARKVVGVGSVGTRAWVILMLGRDDGDPLLLQLKEAQASVLEPYLGASRYSNHGRRIVEGQRLMQAASDILLGWDRTTGIDGVQRDFFVRQLWDRKGSAVVEQMTPRGMRIYARLCGWTLARAHARSGDPVAIAAYLGTGDAFDQAMGSFADAYAEQNERDHAALDGAVADGIVSATVGV
jgi:uncharacterized protein (DUF2252 family)